MLRHFNMHKFALCYMDDFLICGKADTNQCANHMSAMTALCSELGVPLAVEKTVGPTTRTVFLGIEIDTVSQTLSIPSNKYTRLVDMIDLWLIKTTCSRKEVQSLVGTLMFASKCVPSGRLFTRRLTASLSQIRPPVVSITLDRDFYLDLSWWKVFLPRWNGTCRFIKPFWSHSSSINLFTDASATLGCGAFFDGAWFTLRWPQWLLSANFSIEFLEYLPILFACLVWKESFHTRQIFFQCDNLGAVQAWLKLGSSSRAVLHILREITSISAASNFLIRLVHLPGIDNGIADALSRNDMTRFRSLAPLAHPTLVHLPDLFGPLLTAYLSQQWT